MRWLYHILINWINLIRDYMETALMITVVIAFVAALIAMLLTIWDCDFKWVKIFLSIAAISTIGMIIVVTIKVMMSV